MSDASPQLDNSHADSTPCSRGLSVLISMLALLRCYTYAVSHRLPVHMLAHWPITFERVAAALLPSLLAASKPTATPVEWCNELGTALSCALLERFERSTRTGYDLTCLPASLSQLASSCGCQRRVRRMWRYVSAADQFGLSSSRAASHSPSGDTAVVASGHTHQPATVRLAQPRSTVSAQLMQPRIAGDNPRLCHTPLSTTVTRVSSSPRRDAQLIA